MKTIEWLQNTPPLIQVILGTSILLLITSMFFLAYQLLRNGKAIRTLAEAKTLNELSTLITTMDQTQHEFTTLKITVNQFSKKLKKFSGEEDRDSIKRDLKDQAKKIKIPKKDTTENSTELEQLNAEQLFSKIKKDWQDFTGIMKRKLQDRDKPYKGTSMSTSALGLTHGNRRNSLTDEDIDLIAKLHAQYKRFARLQSSKDEWLTPDIYAEFHTLLNWASKRIEDVG